MRHSHRGYIIKRRPRKYLITPQQRRFIEALEFCGIKRGISKAELMVKMKNCIPQYFKGQAQ